MSVEAPSAPLSVYMLADHLDGALAAGEDLVARGSDWRALAENPSAAAQFAFEHRDIAEHVRSLELMLIARTLKAREHAWALAQIDARFAPVANLFASGTAILLDAVEECGDARDADFETGDGLVAYVRSRGLIAPDAATVSNPAQLTIDENFMVAKRVALGPLMDMTASFLDALDTQYELFIATDAGESEPATSPAARLDFGRRERMPLN